MFKLDLKFLIKLIFRLIIAFLVAMVPTLWVLQNDPKVQSIVKEKLIHALQKEWKSSIKIRSCDLNLFTGTLTLNDGQVSSTSTQNKDFLWSFGKADVRFSRLSLFLKNKLSLSLIIEDIKANTLLNDKKLSIVDHLNNIFEPTSDFEVNIKHITLRNFNVEVISADDFFIKKINLELFAKLEIDKIKTAANKFFWQVDFCSQDGKILIDNKNFLSDIKGSATFYKEEGNVDNWFFRVDNSIKFADNIYNICGQNSNLASLITIKDPKSQVDLKFDFTKNLNGFLSFEFLNNVYSFFKDKKLIEQDFKGILNVNLDFDLKNGFKSFGRLQIKDFEYKNNKIDLVEADFLQDSKYIKSKIYIKDLALLDKKADFAGKFFWDIDKEKGKFIINNTTNIIYNNDFYWFINKNKLFVFFDLTKKLDLLGKVYFWATTKDNKNIPVKSSYLFKDNLFKISGRFLDKKFFSTISFDPDFKICQLKYLQKDQSLIDINFLNGYLDGFIKYSFIKTFFPDFLKKNLLGKSVLLNLKLEPNFWNNLKGELSLTGGKLYFPGNYNPMDSFKTNFDFSFKTRELFLNETKIDCVKGNIYSPKSIIKLDKDYKPIFIHVPLKIDNFLINWKRDFYSFVYGNILLSKKNIPDKTDGNFFKVLGDLVLKKTLIKENVFFKNDVSDKSFFSLDSLENKENVIEINLNVLNEKPIKIKNSFLDTNANLKLKFHGYFLNNSLFTPEITGNIDLQKGYLKFLQHKLFIDYGKVQFMPNQMHDPIIDLVAKNKIKKYIISLQASGALQKPNIIFQSWPELTDQEILALLLAGSENASFHENLPEILMQNLNSLFSNHKYTKLTLPLKYVQITPTFSDQSGLGGLKGTLSVDINKQLNAQIQKNFNLQDDFSFKLEYFLTDDLNLRVVKDQRGEIGSEVEVRFKL